MPKLLDIVQLKPDAARHFGFKFGQVTQTNDDGSVFVTGKPFDNGETFLAAKDYQDPPKFGN